MLGPILVAVLLCAVAQQGDASCLSIPPVCNLTAGNDPTVFTNGCPSCSCTVDQSKACAVAAGAAPPPCLLGEEPHRDKNCCLSCLPSATSTPVCSAAQIDLCRVTIYPQLPICGLGNGPSFNNKTCCITCRPAALNSATASCTNAQYLSCLNNLRLCFEGENPIVDTTTCCPTCRRPELLCNTTTVGLCIARRPTCGQGETPVDVQGECCKSCRPTDSNQCSPACSADNTCVAGKCITAKAFRVYVRWSSGAAQSAINDAVKEYIVEIVSRFCNRGSNINRCGAVISTLRSIAKRNSYIDANTNALVVDLTLAVIVSDTATQLAIGIINDALQDSTSVGLDATGANVASRPACNLLPAQLPECGAAETPVLNFTTNCFSCRPAGGLFATPTCTAAKLAACAANFANLPACPAGVAPTRDATTCCLSCQPQSAIAQCTDAQVDACRANYSKLRDCAPGEDAQFSAATCCVSCKVSDRPSLNISCTANDVDRCLLTRPVCGINEQPITNRNISCCPHCRRPERLCTRDDIVSCAETIPDCPNGQEPPTVPGECCPSCRKAEPKCQPACNEWERCFFNFTTGQPSCRVPRKMRFVVRHLNATVASACSNAHFVVLDAIARFCDNADNAVRCVGLRDRLRSIVVRKCVPLESTPGLFDSVAVTAETFEDDVDNAGHVILDQLLDDALSYSLHNDTDSLVAHVLAAEKFRVSCNLLADQIPQCSSGVTPVYDDNTGCLSCRPATGKPCTCALTNVSLVPSCGAAEVPQRDPNTCCPTCIRRSAPKTCSSAELDSCKSSIAVGLLPLCDVGESPMFNVSVCCVSCAPRNASSGDKAGNKGCTADRVASCISKSPVCDIDEQPVQLLDRCCPTCHFPERACAISDVARCAASARVCEALEQPVHLQGDCCPSCVPKLPTCSSPCADGYFCDSFNGTAPVCRALAITVRLVLRRLNDNSPIDCAAAIFAFKEVVRRVCDGPTTNGTKCNIATRIANTVRVLDCARDNDNTFVSVDIPAIPELSGFPVLSFLQGAVQDALVGDASQLFNLANDERTCTLDLSTLPRCATDTTPTYNRSTHCFSCRPSTGRAACTDTEAAACRSVVPRPCAANEVPAHNDTTCCPTCRLQQPVCSAAQIQACAANLTSLPVCALGSFPQFDATSCCVDCRRDSSQQEGHPVNQQCTQAQFDSCIANSPVCANGQKPQRVTGLCCPSCKRPERQCSVADVITCRSNARVCAADEVPFLVDGDCCPSCIQPPANCSQACNSTQVCVPKRNGTSTCRHRGTLLALHFEKGFDGLPLCGNVVSILQEIVNRYCEKNDNAALCDSSSVQDDIAGLILDKCVHPTAGNQSLDVFVAVPTDTVSNLQRRDSTQDSATVVQAAASDPSSSSGLSVSPSTDSGSSGSSNTAIIAGAVAGGVGVVVLAVIVIMVTLRKRQPSLSTPVHPGKLQNPYRVTAF